MRFREAIYFFGKYLNAKLVHEFHYAIWDDVH